MPVVVAALSAPNLHDWWYAMVTYRDQADSIVTGSLSARLDVAWHSLGAAARGLGVLALLAVMGWRRWPLLAVLWLAFATIGVVGGGNFHNHYYQQMAPPLALLAGIGGAELLAAAQPAGNRAHCGGGGCDGRRDRAAVVRLAECAGARGVSRRPAPAHRRRRRALRPRSHRSAASASS